GLDKAQSFFSVTGQRMMELVRFDLLTPVTVAQNVTLPQETYLVVKDAISDEVREQLSPEVAHLLDCHVKSLAQLPAINGVAMTAPTATSAKTEAKAESSKKAAPAKKAAAKKAPAKATAETAEKPKAKQPAAEAAGDIESIIDKACAQFEVSRDDLQSRKRNDLLTQARNQLAAEAKAADSLKAMATWLERSPSTLNSWLK
ncbi:MAG: hypothetical protein R3204_09215, partial [Oceanospirillum sp.]|nr:hypothetical protein [Oceanospirillum sp.]